MRQLSGGERRRVASALALSFGELVLSRLNADRLSHCRNYARQPARPRHVKEFVACCRFPRQESGACGSYPAASVGAWRWPWHSASASWWRSVGACVATSSSWTR